MVTPREFVLGYLAEVRVLPMALCLLTVVLGGFLAVGPHVNWQVMSIVVLNAFLFLYTAHFNDTYWDLRKGEYEPGRKLHAVRLDEEAYLPRYGFGPEIPGAPILPRHHYLWGIFICSALGSAVMLYLSLTLGWMYSALAVGGLILALTYSAGLDEVPALGDTMWEVGVIMALWCGYYSQKMAIDMAIVMLSIPLFFALVSVKAADSLPDTIVDDKTGKVTLTVFLYRRGLSLSAIRHICFIPIYVGFGLLTYIAPTPIRVGALVTLATLVLNHVMLRWDVKGRVTIIAMGLSILFFITYTIAYIMSRSLQVAIP